MPTKLYTGIDLVSVDRIRKSIQKDARFLVRFFGEEECKLFDLSRASVYERIAANFAAKEAFSKALGSGIADFALNEVQALRNASGAPYLQLSGRALAIAQARQLEFSISLSHTKEYATAIVVGIEAV